MRSARVLAALAVTAVALAAAPAASAATWSTEPIPAGPGALGPPRLSFDSQGRGLLLFNGLPSGSGARFTGVVSRAPAGGWSRVSNLPGVGWGDAQGLQYATNRVLFVSGQTASVGPFHRARLRLVVAYGRSDGSRPGAWKTVAAHETGFVAAANRSGQAQGP